MFAKREKTTSESYRVPRREPSSTRRTRVPTARRAEVTRDWKRSRAPQQPQARKTLKAARNRRLGREQIPSGSKFADLLDWGRARLCIVGVLFLLLWCGLWARAYHLQINMGPEYSAMAKRQHTTKEVIQGVRGNILDRNGNIMARSVERPSIWVNPSQIVNKQETANKLAKVLRRPMSKISAQLKGKKSFAWVARKVDYKTGQEIKDMKLTGVYIESEYERVYPYKHLAGQLLGFSDIDEKGIEGLEKSLETELAGRKVTQIIERDAAGRRLVPLGADRVGDLRGKDAHLTIDTQIQFFAEEALAEHVDKYGARWGGCIVVDVPTGDVLAWAQYPFFDPNNVTATPQEHRRNRLATDMLEQGSTIKSFLIAAALEEKVVEPSTEISCENGNWKFKRVTLHDTHAYKNLSVEKILHVSSNIGAAKIGLKLGAKTYHDYLRRLGFGGKTQLPLASEAKGILRNYSKWADIDLATASFGQSFSTTLVQMAQAYLALAGNGEKRPLRLLLDDSDIYAARRGLAAPGSTALANNPFASKAFASSTASENEIVKAIARDNPAAEYERIFSAETAQQVRKMLREVVHEQGGTGKQARIPGVEVGGKTGTAQKADSSGKYGRGRVGSFVGMVPVDNPRYLICVLLDEPTKVQYGGIIAAPVFRHVALHTLAYHGRLPDSDAVLQALSAKEADNSKTKKKASESKTSPKGKKQQEVPGQNADAKKATLAVAQANLGSDESDKINVPSVIGLGLRNAVEAFASQGVVPDIKGKGGTVVRQTPDPGSPWPEVGGRCIIWLEEGSS